MTPSTSAERHVTPAPEIVAAVGDVGRPRAPYPFARDLHHIPGEGGLVAAVRHLAAITRRGLVRYEELVRRYGPVFRGMLGPQPVVFVSDADLVWEILRNDRRAFCSSLPWTEYFLGVLKGDTADGPLSLDFELHRDARRLLQPAFGTPAMADYLDAARPMYDEAIDRWVARGRIPFKAEVRRLFAAVSARIFMGFDDPAEAERLDRAMVDGWRAVLALVKRKPWGIAWRAAMRGSDVLWSMVRPHLDAPRDGKDLLSRLASTQDEASWLDASTRARLFIAVMFGAFDTTSSGSTSMGYLLARHPDWQDRLRTEATAAPEAPGPEEVKALEDHGRVWKEALRLYPVADQLSRQTLAEVELGGYRLPAGTGVVALSGTLGRDPAWWSDPLRFDPDRFSPERAEDKRHKATYLPFGGGAHACIGAQLAGVEVGAFWHRLLRRCRIRLPRDYEAQHTYTPIGMIRGEVELIVEAL